MGITERGTGKNHGHGKAGRAGEAGTVRLIRFLVALAGGDPRQCQLPPLKRPLRVTVQRGDTDELRYIVIAPAGRAVAGNFVHIAGPVVAVNATTVQVQGNSEAAPVSVTLAGAGNVPQLGQWLAGCGQLQGQAIVIEQWEVKDV